MTAIKGAGSNAKLATFDLSPDVIKDIKAGTSLFAVDQQQYLQGYLPVVFLKLFKTNANTVGGGLPVLTGPGFVDKSNAATVEKLAGGGHALQRSRAAGLPAAGRPPVSHPRGERRDQQAPHVGPATGRADHAAGAGRRRRPAAPTSGSPRSARGPPPAPPGDRRAARRGRRAIFFWTQNSLFLKLDGIANWTDVASTIGIPAVVVALLMIGGEFDLSAGVMTGSAGLMMGILATEVEHEHLARDRADADRRQGASASLNGYMVMRTKLPSFIVTLATFFILQGVNLGVTKAITNQVSVSGIDTAAGLREREQDLRRDASGRPTTSASPCCGGSRSRCSPPGCSRARASATGSSASAATPTRPATSASRWPASRSGCS